ncbi:unnamed protein product, partial [Trichobilharzia regenti]
KSYDLYPTIVVPNFTANPDRLRQLFPTSIDVRLDRERRKAYVKFPSLEVRQAAISEPKFFDGKKLSIGLVGGPELKTAVILRVPASVQDSELESLFPGVVSLSRQPRSPKDNSPMNNRPGGGANFRGSPKFGGNPKHNSQRGRGGQSFRGRGGQSFRGHGGGQSPRGRGGQSFRGRGGNRGGWSKRGSHNKEK